MKWINGIVTALLVAVSGHALSEVVLETDDSVATKTGTWTASTSIAGYYGTGFATAAAAGGADVMRFLSPRTITTTGSWCIQAHWTAAANRSIAASYQVFDGTTLRATFIANQQLNGGAWRRLGCVILTRGLTSEVRLTDTGAAAGTVVVGDGVRWVWEESPVALDYCIAVNNGFGLGGTTFIAKNFVVPPVGTCKSWSGIMRTASTVVGTSTGTACLSNDGKLFTASLQTTAPEFLGIGTLGSDHIELCPLAATLGCPAHAGQSDRGTFGGPAKVIACTAALTTIPSSHD